MIRMPSHRFDTLQTPLGPFSVSVDDTGAVTGAAFGGADALQARIGRATLIRDPAAARAALSEVQAWLSGRTRHFSLPLNANGSAFQKRVWSALLESPYGETRSYGEVARALKSSARAVGRANATNPICLLVPCHRVIGADGSLTGYAFGEDTKRRLLAIERSAA